MKRILAIDPGSQLTAWLLLAPDGAPALWAKAPNDQVIGWIRAEGRSFADIVVIEWTAPRGMPASAELFETLWWAGRFREASRPVDVERLNRLDVKRHLCGTTASTDANVRAALIDRYGGAGGKEAAIGRKAAQGPLYGIAADVWAALGVAVTYRDRLQEGLQP